MKKIIRLTESDLARIVKRVIKENSLNEDLTDHLRKRAIYQNIMKDVRSGEINKHELKTDLNSIAKDAALKLKTFITDDEIDYDLRDMFFGNTEISDYEYPESDWR